MQRTAIQPSVCWNRANAASYPSPPPGSERPAPQGGKGPSNGAPPPTTEGWQRAALQKTSKTTSTCNASGNARGPTQSRQARQQRCHQLARYLCARCWQSGTAPPAPLRAQPGRKPSPPLGEAHHAGVGWGKGWGGMMRRPHARKGRGCSMHRAPCTGRSWFQRSKHSARWPCRGPGAPARLFAYIPPAQRKCHGILCDKEK
jgi:hypothetical protein